MNYEQTEIIFAIEKSLTLKKYLDELIESYISPAITYFSGGISEENDVFFTKSSTVQYGVVFFGSEFSMAGSASQMEIYGPTTSQTTLMNIIKDNSYCCKNTSRQAYILEALKASTEVFKVMCKKSKTENSKKFLILVTQSAPFQNPWCGFGHESIILELKKMNVKTSVFGAHKLVELYRLFESTGGDPQSITMKNYASKPQHLILLNGFTLQERPISPSLVNQPNAAQAGSNPTPPIASMPMQPISSAPIVSQTNPTQPNRPTPPPGLMTSQSNPRIHHPNVNQNPQPSLMRANIRNLQQIPSMGNTVGRPPIPVMSGNAMINRPNRWGGMVNNQSQNQIRASNIGLQMSQPGTPQPMSNLPPGASPDQVPPNSMMQQANQMNRTISTTNIIWQGALEWSENKKSIQGNGNASLQRIPCKISSTTLANGELDIKTDGWPATLQMLLVQKNLLSSVGNVYFQNIHKVMFHPDPCPALESLTASLSQGFAGCVNLSSTSSDVKMIILLFSSDRHAYVGFIPLEQAAFVAKIKQVFQQQSRTQAMNKQNPGGSNMIPGSVGNMQMTGPSQGIQMMPNTSVGQGNMMMQQQMNSAMSQQGSMQGSNQLSGPASQMGSNQGQAQMGQTPGQSGPNQVQMGQNGPNQGQMGQNQGQVGQNSNQIGPNQMNQNINQMGQMGSNQSQLGQNQGQMQISQNQQIPMGHQIPMVSQMSSTPMGGKMRPIGAMGGPGQQMESIQMRPGMQHIRQQMQMNHRPGMQVNMGQARMMPQMRHILHQQRLQQQQQIMMLQQQQGGMRATQMNQGGMGSQGQGQQVIGQGGMGPQSGGQQVMGQGGMGPQSGGQQVMGQGGMGPQSGGQQVMGQGGMGPQGQQIMSQNMNQQGGIPQNMGQSMQDNPSEYMDIV